MLILRIVVGLLFIGHGAQKLFGWFGGYGLAGTAGAFGSMGMRPAGLWAFMAGLSEAGGGLLLALGLLNPLGSLGVAAAMLVAITTVHWGRLWASDNGIELPLAYLTTAVAVAIAGPGRYSLDATLGIQLPMPLSFIGGMVLVLLGVATVIGTTQRPVPVALPATEVEPASRAA
jgi:putative oxidoreductase